MTHVGLYLNVRNQAACKHWLVPFRPRDLSFRSLLDRLPSERAEGVRTGREIRIARPSSRGGRERRNSAAVNQLESRLARRGVRRAAI